VIKSNSQIYCCRCVYFNGTALSGEGVVTIQHGDAGVTCQTLAFDHQRLQTLHLAWFTVVPAEDTMENWEGNHTNPDATSRESNHTIPGTLPRWGEDPSFAACELAASWEDLARDEYALSSLGGLDVIRKEAWPFYRTISGVCLCWELEEPNGPKG